MKLYIGEKLVEFSEKELNKMYVDEGYEAVVYKYGEDALKIYKSYCYKERLNDEGVTLLSQYSSLTKRILLPKDSIYDEKHHFCGYTTDFIYKSSIKDIFKMSIPSFLTEFDAIRDDVIFLSEKSVYLGDFCGSNVVYDGNINLVDPGSYSVYKVDDTSSTLLYNQLELNYLFVSLLSLMKVSDVRRCALAEKIVEYDYVGDFIRKTALDGENVKTYVKRITR